MHSVLHCIHHYNVPSCFTKENMSLFPHTSVQLLSNQCRQDCYNLDKGYAFDL